MIEVRLGQSWKRGGRADELRDAFFLELDGVNALPGLTDEPLVPLVQGLVDGVHALTVGGERSAQVALEGAHGELCLWRQAGTSLELSQVALAPAARRLRHFRVDLADFKGAAVRCARSFLRDAAVEVGLKATIEAQLRALESSPLKPVPEPPTGGWSLVRAPAGGLGFTFFDEEDRTASYTRRTRGGLAPLLYSGDVTVDLVPSSGPPFLALMALSREAEGRPEPRRRAIFEAGLDACLGLRQHNPALADNPWVEALHQRCVEGLAALRVPLPDFDAVAPTAAGRERAQAPLEAPGALRRVKLGPRWLRPAALGEEGGRLTLGRSLIVVGSAHAAHGFSARGETRFRFLAPRGLAVSPAGEVLRAEEGRLTFHVLGERGARWIRDHDGLTLGPALFTRGHTRVTGLAGRGAVAYDVHTGRELWRFAPPKTQTAWLTLLEGRVLVSTDSGTLWGLDVGDGNVRFRVRAGLPFVGAAVPVAGRALAVLNRGEHTALFLCNALAPGGAVPAGAVEWTREFTLSSPSAPVAHRGRTFLAGARDGRTVVMAVGRQGQGLWERVVPCDARTVTLSPFEGGVLASDARGACVRVLADGDTAWAIGSDGDELAQRIPVRLARRLLVLPGTWVRLVDPASGRVLGEVEAGPALADVAVDGRLGLYLYKEPGVLEAYAPATVLSVL